LDRSQQFVTVVETAIRICKLAAMTFVATTLRRYEEKIASETGVDAKKIRPIKQILVENFARPSLSTLQRLARYSYHLIDDHAPSEVYTLRAVMAENPTLGPLGDLLDDLERVFPPHRQRVRIVNKKQLKKPVLDYLLFELAKYEGRTAEATEIAFKNDPLRDADPSTWCSALLMLAEIFAPLRHLVFRVRNVERVRNNSDEFIVLLKTYRDGKATTEEVTQTFADLKDDRLETYELVLDSEVDHVSLDLFPFLTIKADRLHYYNRTSAQGYEFIPAVGPIGHWVPTKRKFSHAALQSSTGAAALQGLFWAQVAPSVSDSGVRANIPAQEPIVGRKQQIDAILEEIVQIPNQNGIVYGPGGVGKTALLIELSRQLYEETSPERIYFQNIIWVSAKRDFYDPALDEVEVRTPQFQSLDNVLAAILEFHEWEDANAYERDAKKWLVTEHLREEKTLLILDNFESIPTASQKEIIRFFGVEIKQALRDKPDYFKALITSRELIPSSFHQISLKGLDNEESKELVQRLYMPYQRSGKAQLSNAQINALYEATQGIPLIMKHCYGQIYEYGGDPDRVLKNLPDAANKVVEFSFAEIFRLVKEDDLQLRILLLLELSGRPLMLRHMADIFGAAETDIADRITRLANFQCVYRSDTGTGDKYAISDEVRFFTRRLTQEHAALATQIKRQIASLAIEKRMDYSKEELDALIIFEDYLGRGHFLSAEDFIKEQLKLRPISVLLNLRYARYLKEIKQQTEDAIERLEAIRKRSGNDQQVLRLLMNYYAALEPPKFDQANTYARELGDIAIDNNEIRFEIAHFYIVWSTATKMKFEVDPLKEMVRQQTYKTLAEEGIKLLTGVAGNTHEQHHLLAQGYYNKWDYNPALRNIEKAIQLLPKRSHLREPYRGLRAEILTKRTQFTSSAGRGS
jgi:GTPase SAR1 family protein